MPECICDTRTVVTVLKYTWHTKYTSHTHTRTFFCPITPSYSVAPTVLLTSAILHLLCLSSPAHPAGISFCFYTGFLAFFSRLSSIKQTNMALYRPYSVQPHLHIQRLQPFFSVVLFSFYSVYLPQRILLDFPSVFTLATLPYLSFVIEQTNVFVVVIIIFIDS